MRRSTRHKYRAGFDFHVKPYGFELVIHDLVDVLYYEPGIA